MSLRWDDARSCLDLGVGDLLGAERLHLERSAAFSTLARAEAGQQVHREIQASQELEAEVRIRHRLVLRGWTVTIHGRLDGLGMEDGHTVVEEIKSTGLPEHLLAEIPAFPAWERQLRLYLWFLEEARKPTPRGRLRIVSLVDGAQRILELRPDPALPKEILGILDEWLLERERRNAWLSRRRQAGLPFAFPEYRPGQEEAVRQVEAAIHEGQHLLLSAPTGLGKTAAVLHGALAAARARDLQILWVTARGPQRQVAYRTLRQIVARGGRELSAVLLTSQDKLCLNRVVDCRPESCEHAAFYHQKLRESDALEQLPPLSEAPHHRSLGEQLKMCPHALATDRGRRVDVMIGDYNHAFSPDAELRGLDWERWILVVDEAHQLPERAISQASPRLDRWQVQAVLDQYQAPDQAAFRELAQAVWQELDDCPLLSTGIGDAEEAVVELNPRRWLDLGARFDELGWDHLRLRPDEEAEDPWLLLARTIHSFVRALDGAGEETVALAGPGHLRLFCRDPARILAPRFARFAATICLSATLRPFDIFRDRCGLPPNRLRTFEADPFFPPEHRLVVAVPGISTAWKDRERDRAAVTTLVQSSIEAVPGNVAVYFSSFQQLEDVLVGLDLRGRMLLRQGPSMGEEDRERLLGALAEPLPVHRVLLGVLGGIFAEGVDLPGALAAVIIVGPSLPPPGLDRKLQQSWLEERYGDGFERTFVAPGLSRVVQAAGRVIRAADEKGAVILLCRRFLQDPYRRYLPGDWKVQRQRDPAPSLRAFFGGQVLPAEEPAKPKASGSTRQKRRQSASSSPPPSGPPPEISSEPTTGTQMGLFLSAPAMPGKG